MNNTKRKEIVTVYNSEKYIGIHFTTNHTGKMQGMQSLSTSTLENSICRKRAKNEKSICNKCFSETMHKRYTSLAKCLARNTEILTTSIIPMELLPIINAHSFRLESFGDLNNVTQVINYFNLCRKNKNVTFALWSKNPWIIKETIETGHKKPNNLVIIYSSPFINNPVPIDRMQKVYPFIDKVFTVYKDEKTAKENNAKINCGSRNCLECLKCYSKRTTKEINELLK